MNALSRWWRNLTLPDPRSVAANHVGTDFIIGNTRRQSWEARMKEATAMRERGVNEPWLRQYLEACKDRISAMHADNVEPSTDAP